MRISITKKSKYSEIDQFPKDIQRQIISKALTLYMQSEEYRIIKNLFGKLNNNSQEELVKKIVYKKESIEDTEKVSVIENLSDMKISTKDIIDLMSEF